MVIIELLFVVLALAASWVMYQKMGRKGWEGIIPYYNTYVLMKELYGNGWRMLLFLIPFYNIYLCFKVYIDLAHCFHYSTGFGVGLTLLFPVFGSILAFGNSVYGDGSKATKSDDPITETINSAANFVADQFSKKNEE